MQAIVHNLENNEENSKENIDWHCIYGHAGKNTLKRLGKEGIRNSDCHDCMKNNIKIHNAYRDSTDKYLVETPFYKVHADLCFVNDGKEKGYGSATSYILV